MSEVKKTTNTNKISNETASRVSELSKMSYEVFYSWIPAGSGNYENTVIDGRYRENCNTRNIKLKCVHGHKSKKKIYLHCNKLDCETCFVSGCSRKARQFNERFTEFRKLCYRNSIYIGKVIHFSLILNAEKDRFINPKEYAKFKKNVIYPLLQKIGILGGVLFLHLWSKTCIVCGENRTNCKCEGSEYRKELNIHIHVLGFGYLMNARKFHELYPDYVYRNHLPRRKEVYHTAFYITSKLALWRNENGTLRNAYHYFGFLNPKKFRVAHKHKFTIVDKCPECDTPRVVKEIQDHKIAHDNWIYSVKAWKRHYEIADIESLREAVNNLQKNNKR